MTIIEPHQRTRGDHYLEAYSYVYEGSESVVVRAGRRKCDDEGRPDHDRIEVYVSPAGRSVRVWWNGIEISRPEGEQTP